MASKNFGFCVPHSRTALVNVKSRKSSAVMQCSAADEMGALSAIVAVIDRYAFWCSVFVGIAGWVYIDSRRVPAAFTRECGTQLRRFFLLCSAATGALIASVISDGVLTSFGWSTRHGRSTFCFRSSRWRSKSRVRVCWFRISAA